VRVQAAAIAIRAVRGGTAEGNATDLRFKKILQVGIIIVACVAVF
jgi:hypothetical protein